jgi:predicted membrane channel-forming protein YqfA (hemolysin III family)
VQAGIQNVVETPVNLISVIPACAGMTEEAAENSCLNFSNHTSGHANQLITTWHVFVNGTAVLSYIKIYNYFAGLYQIGEV